ncbi:MAG: hypothetical protein C4570_02130 [Ammonifex sp.]|jgi:hypothetical protein|nr:MAG: hypothetical protein C4570_02130 [Ammonifex sp.]
MEEYEIKCARISNFSSKNGVLSFKVSFNTTGYTDASLGELIKLDDKETLCSVRLEPKSTGQHIPGV